LLYAAKTTEDSKNEVKSKTTHLNPTRHSEVGHIDTNGVVRTTRKLPSARAVQIDELVFVQVLGSGQLLHAAVQHRGEGQPDVAALRRFQGHLEVNRIGDVIDEVDGGDVFVAAGLGHRERELVVFGEPVKARAVPGRVALVAARNVAPVTIGPRDPFRRTVAHPRRRIARGRLTPTLARTALAAVQGVAVVPGAASLALRSRCVVLAIDTDAAVVARAVAVALAEGARGEVPGGGRTLAF